MFSKAISLFLCLALLSCHMLLPIVEAGHGHHGNNEEGLAVLLAAGLLAKILGKHKHEEHHIHIPVPVHHDHHEHHGHGSGSTRIYVHHPGPFHHVHGGMMTSASAWNPAMIPRYVYRGEPMYPPHPY